MCDPASTGSRSTPISSEGKTGTAIESTVYGRGPAKRLEIVTEKKTLIAGGVESTLVYVRAFDQWNHPSADDQVLLEVSAGTLLSEACGKDVTNPCAATNASIEQSSLPGSLSRGTNSRRTRNARAKELNLLFGN